MPGGRAPASRTQHVGLPAPVARPRLHLPSGGDGYSSRRHRNRRPIGRHQSHAGNDGECRRTRGQPRRGPRQRGGSGTGGNAGLSRRRSGDAGHRPPCRGGGRRAEPLRCRQGHRSEQAGDRAPCRKGGPRGSRGIAYRRADGESPPHAIRPPPGGSSHRRDPRRRAGRSLRAVGRAAAPGAGPGHRLADGPGGAGADDDRYPEAGGRIGAGTRSRDRRPDRGCAAAAHIHEKPGGHGAPGRELRRRARRPRGGRGDRRGARQRADRRRLARHRRDDDRSRRQDGKAGALRHRRRALGDGDSDRQAPGRRHPRFSRTRPGRPCDGRDGRGLAPQGGGQRGRPRDRALRGGSRRAAAHRPGRRGCRENAGIGLRHPDTETESLPKPRRGGGRHSGR